MSEKNVTTILKTARERMGMTQGELAIRAGISLSNLTKLEQGLIGEPGWWTVVRLAEVLVIDLNELAASADRPENVADRFTKEPSKPSAKRKPKK